MTRRKTPGSPPRPQRQEGHDPPSAAGWAELHNLPDRRKPGSTQRGPGPHFHRRTDDKIREEVWELLTNNADLDASDMELHVEGGEVTLTGTVDSRDARWLAEDLVNSVTGVREVNNRLKVLR
jgi:osmotically-inducible protein OsmY